MSNLAKFIPLNPIEHENELRTIILKHQGSTSGNPTQWVVDACAEVFQRGFGLGFDAGTMSRVSIPPKPRFQVEMPGDVRSGQEPTHRTNAISGQPERGLLPFVSRVDKED